MPSPHRVQSIDKKIIYIAGFGYSGSTLLERILATHPKVVGCGEVFSLNADFSINETCSCGASLEKCGHWSPVYAQFLETETPIDEYEVFSLLSQNTDEVEYFVDSSKTSFKNLRRPFRLRKMYEEKVVHIIRNPNDCYASMLERGLVSAGVWGKIKVGLHWSFANLGSILFGLLYPSDALKISYKTLTHNPIKVLNEIFRFLSLDPEPVLQYIHQNRPFPLTHQLSGNRCKRDPDLRIKMR